MRPNWCSNITSASRAQREGEQGVANEGSQKKGKGGRGMDLSRTGWLAIDVANAREHAAGWASDGMVMTRA